MLELNNKKKACKNKQNNKLKINKDLYDVRNNKVEDNKYFKSIQPQKKLELDELPQMLKMADLGVYLDRPLTSKAMSLTSRPKATNLNDKNYDAFNKNAFAPSPANNYLAKIQSLENFFRNESLSFSKIPGFTRSPSRVETPGMRPKFENTMLLKSNQVISIPGSPTTSDHWDKYNESPRPISNHYPSEYKPKTPMHFTPKEYLKETPPRNSMQKGSPSAVAGFPKKEFKERLTKSHREKRRTLNSQGNIRIEDPTKSKDTIEVLENLLNNQHRVKTVPSRTTRTTYKKKLKRPSPRKTPEIAKYPPPAKKNKDLFCLLGSPCFSDGFDFKAFGSP